MIGAEPRRAYNRVLLSSLLAGEVGGGRDRTEAGRVVARARRHHRSSDRKVDRDRSRRVLRASCETAATVAYDRLVLATGSEPIRLPLPGAELPGVLTFRDLADVDRIRSRLPLGSARPS